MSIASLAMYDLPEVEAATDAWWAGLAQAMRREGIEDVPVALSRGDDARRAWRAPDLLFSQTCGYPLTHEFAGRLRVVATPCYACPGCAGPRYRSFLLVRADDSAAGLADLRDRIAAVNGTNSQSGYSALRGEIAPLAHSGKFFSEVIVSGGHANSMALVAEGRADVCAVDCVTHALLSRHRPAAVAGLRVLGETAGAPGLPYVTRADAGDDLLRRLRAALFAALGDPGLAAARDTLLIAGAEVLPNDAYERILEIEQVALAHDYARLA